MPDINHLWGNDLAFSATGDLATADVPTLTQQRVLRRLLTNPGDYIWELDYGAGLASSKLINPAASMSRSGMPTPPLPPPRPSPSPPEPQA